MSDLAPMREQVYQDPRPKEHFDRFHTRSRTREPDWAYELTRILTSLYGYTFLRARAISTDNVPGSGAVILAPNHFSFMDHFLMGCYIRRKVRFMAKSQLFKRPMQFIYTHGGVFPVRRGARDEETFITARTILARGAARIRTGKRLRFPQVTIQYGEAMCWEQVEDPTPEQQQAVADAVLVEIRRLYAGLEEHGRKGVLKRVREQRRAARRAPEGAAVA